MAAGPGPHGPAEPIRLSRHELCELGSGRNKHAVTPEYIGDFASIESWETHLWSDAHRERSGLAFRFHGGILTDSPHLSRGTIVLPGTNAEARARSCNFANSCVKSSAGGQCIDVPLLWLNLLQAAYW